MLIKFRTYTIFILVFIPHAFCYIYANTSERSSHQLCYLGQLACALREKLAKNLGLWWRKRRLGPEKRGFSCENQRFPLKLVQYRNFYTILR